MKGTGAAVPVADASTGEGFQPEVELIAWFDRPYDLAVATARTCYSSRVRYPHEMAATERDAAIRDRIAASTYRAGHHTTIQHPTFTFVLKRVSRQFIWTFLHSHSFYNSEQVSQRYVRVRPGNHVVPPLQGEARRLFLDGCSEAMAAYRDLCDLLWEPVAREYFRIYPGRRGRPERWRRAIEKRVMEMARYVLPVATCAHLYHTVAGVTLHRYHRLCLAFDAPAETRVVVGRMVEAVRRVDPLFFERIEDPIPLEETPEYRLYETFHQGEPASAEFCREFDASLGRWRHSVLVDYKVAGERTMAQAVRSVFGLPRERLGDAEAIACVLDPARNRLLGESLNLTNLSKLCRTMVHPHFTFRKKLSHTADSQEQRHRTVPGSRPILRAQIDPDRPDTVMPEVIRRTPEARERFEEAVGGLWRRIGRLLESGVPVEFAHYLLPNAVAVRFEESADLMGLHHKWRMRLCYLAQEEIWRASLEEVQQVRQVCPEIGKYLGPPCLLRRMAGKRPYCPEGERFCGVPVWDLDLDRYERVI